MTDCGINIYDDYIIFSDFEFAGFESMNKLLSLPVPPEAICR